MYAVGFCEILGVCDQGVGFLGSVSGPNSLLSQKSSIPTNFSNACARVTLVRAKIRVCQVANHFGEHGKIWGVRPSHGQYERDGNQQPVGGIPGDAGSRTASLRDLAVDTPM
jgi:hypothetical protein